MVNMTVAHPKPPTKDGENGYIKANGKHQDHFIERVTSLPIVKDSVSKAQEVANKSFIGRWTLSTFQYVSEKQPEYIQGYYQQYLEPHLDLYGGRSLDYVQAKVPLIDQPSVEVIDAIKQPVKAKVDNTLQTVTYPAHVIAGGFNRQLTRVIDHLEGTIETYLPPSQEDDLSQTKSMDSENQAIRAYDLMLKLTQRLNHALPKSRQELANVAQANGLIQSTVHQLQMVQETLVVYGQAAQERLPSSVNLRVQQTTELIQKWTSQVHQQLSTLTDREWIKHQLSLASEQLDVIKAEWARTDVSVTEKSRLTLQQIHSNLLPLFQSIQSQLHLLLKQN
ncbi:hypothetical protein G6F49_006053 [Rhizopus delemar]|nr:hypothetical protein G6F49_006053 [Rhizopus delemar]KAG1641442.1 hypothetical protein G6F44_005821 [Rhizopus delemar]